MFLADSSPDAYPNLVGRLLASPRYGERQATFWLDLVRYAETNGFEVLPMGIGVLTVMFAVEDASPSA